MNATSLLSHFLLVWRATDARVLSSDCDLTNPSCRLPIFYTALLHNESMFHAHPMVAEDYPLHILYLYIMLYAVILAVADLTRLVR